MGFRKITEDEKRLLSYLISKSNIDLSDDWVKILRVSEMNDGMGSLYLSLTSDNVEDKRKYEKTISECHFKDSDGITVIASLNVDAIGKLYELDIWKVDFTKLQNIPLNFD